MAKSAPQQAENEFLDSYVTTLFQGERYLTDLDLKLQREGIVRLRDLIAIPSRELFQRFRTTKDNQKRVRLCLRDVGLKLQN